MKNTVDTRLLKLCEQPGKLKSYISQKLHKRAPQTFRFSERPGVPAAVLIPLFFKEGQAHILFTKRTEHLSQHKGQIAFPGGKADQEDADLMHTALRETREEVGIKSEHVQVLGRTDNFLTNTFYLVSPFVGMYDFPYPYKVNHHEIDRLIEVPLAHLLQPEIFEQKPFHKDGNTWLVHYYYYESDVIWGVTGFLLSNFISILTGRTFASSLRG